MSAWGFNGLAIDISRNAITWTYVELDFEPQVHPKFIISSRACKNTFLIFPFLILGHPPAGPQYSSAKVKHTHGGGGGGGGGLGVRVRVRVRGAGGGGGAWERG